MATLFAIILALALIKGMEEFDKAKFLIDEETSTLVGAIIMLRYFEEGELKSQDRHDEITAKNNLKNKLSKYLDRCLNLKDNKKNSDNWDVIIECQEEIIKLANSDPKKPKNKPDFDDFIAKANLIRKLDSLNIIRLRRIDFFSGDHIHKIVMFALWIMALAMLLPFLAEPLCVDRITADKNRPGSISSMQNLDRDYIQCPADFNPDPNRLNQYYMILVVASFLSFMMFMLHDLNNPIGGFWSVDTSQYKAAKDVIKQLDEQQNKKKDLTDKQSGSTSGQSSVDSDAPEMLAVLTTDHQMDDTDLAKKKTDAIVTVTKR